MAEQSENENELLVLAEQGDPEAQHQMGLLCLLDIVGPADLEGAEKWFRKAAEQDFASSKIELEQLLKGSKPNFLQSISEACHTSLRAHPDHNAHFPAVLVVDDDPTIVTLVQSMLEGQPVRLASAGHSDRALAFINQESHLLLVILDYKLPGPNGLQILNSLRARPGGDAINVVMMSGCSQPEYIIQAKKNGVLTWMVKPLDRLKIVEIVRNLLKNA